MFPLRATFRAALAVEVEPRRVTETALRGAAAALAERLGREAGVGLAACPLPETLCPLSAWEAPAAEPVPGSVWRR